MADAGASIFNKKATEKLRSPDDLDKYIMVTNPGVWVVLLACAALLVGLLAWGIFGTVSTNVAATGTNVDGKVVCYLSTEDVYKVRQGDSANVNGAHMTVADIGAVPSSRSEAAELLNSDYLVSVLLPGDWGYQVTFAENGDDAFARGVPLQVSITTERIAPITLVLGGNN